MCIDDDFSKIKTKKAMARSTKPSFGEIYKKATINIIEDNIDEAQSITSDNQNLILVEDHVKNGVSPYLKFKRETSMELYMNQSQAKDDSPKKVSTRKNNYISCQSMIERAQILNIKLPEGYHLQHQNSNISSYRKNINANQFMGISNLVTPPIYSTTTFGHSIFDHSYISTD